MHAHFELLIPSKAAIDEYNKAVAGMKIAADKVTRDLAQVALIEASLKTKKWDTQKLQDYLKAEAAVVAKEKDGLFEQWVLFKQIGQNHTMSKLELKEKAEEASHLTKAVVEVFKKFAKDTLSGFRS